MSFAQEEEELDWGDAVDVVSLGDEDEIPCIAAVEENIGEETAPIHSAQEEDTESGAVSTKSPLAAALSHPLGLSHLPPKPQSVLPRRRSRETIKASSMSRAYPRAHSPGAGDDLPRFWEVRRTETVIYYYHTESRCSQMKRPTRDDPRLDKNHWNGDAPPSAPDRSQPARNPPSVRTGPAEWPERSAPDHQHRSSARDKSPSRRTSPPRQRSPNTRPRSNSSQQPAPARAMSPSSMLLPRRGASPARGLAKPSSKPQRTEPDAGISSDPQDTRIHQDSRHGRSRDSGWEQRGRGNTREPEISRNNGRCDHYSPPPETDDSPRRESRHRSISPPRKATAMRSDAMVISQHSRRSLSPRDREDARAYDRPFDRNDSRFGREYPIDLRRAGGEYPDPREDHFRAGNGRVPSQYPPAPEPASRDSASFSPHPEDTGYQAPPGKFRDGRYGARPENRRAQSSRTNVRSSRVDPQENDTRLSPTALRNEVPLPPRHEFISPHEGPPSHRRPRNGDIRGRMIPEDRAIVLPSDEGSIDHEQVSPPHVERDLHPDIRQDEHNRRHDHRHSVSGEEYMARRPLSPQTTRDRRLPNDVAEPREPDFRPRDREPERYPPKERRDQHESYPRGLRPDDPIPHMYEASTVPHGRRIAPRESETLPGRIYPPAEPQRPPSPAPPVRGTYPRRYVREDQFPDRPPRWDREVEAANASEEARHGRKPQTDARRGQREAVSDTEYVEARDEGRSRQRRGSRFEKPEAEPRPEYKRRTTRDGSPPYEPEDRQWTPRDAHPPLPPAQMEVDPPHVHPPEKELSGWANFRRRRERSRERGEPYRNRAGARDSWHPSPSEGQDMEVEVVEGGKRQRIEGGTRMTQSFNHREEDLPRKVPHHSPTQRPKIHSPTISLSKLPPPALASQSPVNAQAAFIRAKEVANQLNQLSKADPQHKPRPKSRFDQPSDSTVDREMNRELLVPNGSFGGFGAVNTSDTAITPEANERSTPEEANDGRQGSEGSHSSHIVMRMDEASLRDNGYPQRSAGRHRDSRADPGPSRRDRNRSENHRNGGRNNGEKPSRFIDSYRPGDENPGRGTGGMRAWGNPEIEPQRDPPPHTSTPSTNRTYRNGDRFSRPLQIITGPEGLPPRPPSPTEAPRSARSRGQMGGQTRSPSGQGGRSFIAVTDTDAPDAATDNEIDLASPAGFSFRQASATSPRKYSLLDRMTDPASGAPLTVPPKERGSGGNGHQSRRPRSHRTNSRR